MELTEQNYRPELGNYYTSLIWHYSSAAVLLIFAILLIFLMLVPLSIILRGSEKPVKWFDAVTQPIERKRRFTQAWIFLGTDPRVWSALSKK